MDIMPNFGKEKRVAFSTQGGWGLGGKKVFYFPFLFNKIPFSHGMKTLTLTLSSKLTKFTF